LENNDFFYQGEEEMKGKVTIKSFDGCLEFSVEFLDTVTSKLIQKHLPLESTVNLWGDEIYFDTTIEVEPDDLTKNVSVGDLAYWPQGRCLCIFFGPTPASTASQPVPASEVALIGKVTVSKEKLRAIRIGSKISLRCD